MPSVDLSSYNNSWYNPGGNALKRTLWYFTNLLIVKNAWIPVSGLKVRALRLFGAKIGHGVVIKPGVNVKYPWLLTIGDHAWIGENAWIDNLAQVVIGPNCCISQGAMLLTGNHNFQKTTFDLMLGPITLEAGAWVGAQATVCPGVTLHSHAVLTVGSVATSDLEANTIYQGNPAKAVKTRVIA